MCLAKSNWPGDFRGRLTAAGLADQADLIVSLDRDAIQLESEAIEDDSDRVGSSRLGGNPDLDPSEPWPTWNGTPLSFLAQVGLAGLPALPANPLPTDGLLSFFYEPEQSVWGFDPNDVGAWRVICTAPTKRLERREPPQDLPQHGRFRACRLTGSVVKTHAPPESAEIREAGLSREQLLAYHEVVDPEGDDEGPRHQLLGHAEPIQGDMQLECQLASHGLYCGDSSGYNDPRAATLGTGAANWRLLIQIDTDDNAQMMWGDAGRVYFWMTEEALATRNWDSAWMVLQCY